MLKILTYIPLILFTFFFTSCEEEIVIEYIDVEKYVVVNSTFSPNKEFEVNLSYSKNVLDQDASDQWIEYAEIKVLRGDGVYLFTPEYVGEGNYKASTFPIENQVYRIEIKVEGYPLISASSRVPTQAIVKNVTSTNIAQDGNGAVKVDFEIQDSEDIDNYYIWEVLLGQYTSDNPAFNPALVLDGIQTLGPSESVQNNGKWSKLFIQELDLTSGISFLSFHDRAVTNPDDPGQFLQETEAYLKVISASSDYYKNLLSIVELENKGQNPGNSSVILSSEYHSNIEGGFGIFAGYNEQLIKL